MINYQQKDGFVAVKWKKTEIGRIQPENGQHVYSPRGCGGAIKSDPMNSVQDVKQYIEKEKLAIVMFYG